MGNNEKIRVVKFEDWKKKQNKRRPEKTEASPCFPQKADISQNIIKIHSKMPIIIVLLISIIIGFMLIMSLSFAVSQSQDNQNNEWLQSELNSLVSELSNSGYDWLTNYNIEYPYVSVFRENSNNEVARFSFILNESWYKIYLSNLTENESYDTFDLKILGEGGVEFDYVVDPSLTFMAGSSLITLNSPTNNSNFNVGSVTFNVTSNDTLNWCGVSINSQANVTMGNTSATAFNWTNSSISDGRYNFTITCNDTTGSFGNSGINWFLIDTVIPTLNVTSPVNSSNYNSSSVLFNVSSSELGTGSIIPDIDNSLVSWWRMDDVNQTGLGAKVYDYTGRNNGTAYGNATQTSAGKLGKGMSFDGNGDYVNVPHNTNQLLTSGGTISAWVYPRYLGYTKIVDKSTSISGANGWTFMVNGDTGGKISFNINAGTSASSAGSSILVNNWYYVSATFNSSGYATLYINGIQSGTPGGTSDPSGIITTNALQIGRYIGGGRDFNGTIDDVMIFNRSLSAEEILSLYNATRLEHTETNLSDGAHTFTAYTQDLAGNMANSGLIEFDVDTTFPTITISSPLNNTNYSYNILFNVSSSETTAGTGSIVPNFDNSLVGWWRMDDVNQTGLGAKVYDYTGRNNGTAVGNASQTDAGKLGKGMSFDGDGDYVSVANSNFINFSQKSVFVWIKPPENSGTNIVDVYSSGYWVAPYGDVIRYRYDENKFQIFVKNSSGTSVVEGDVAFTVNVWHFIGYTYNGSLVTYYLDGASAGTPDALTGLIDSSSYPVYIGGVNSGGAKTYFNGTIDDVMIFNRSLDAGEILSLYNATRLEHTENLSDGQHTYTTYVQDWAGNVNSSAVSFLSDITPPAITILYPDNATVHYTATIDFNVSVSDATLGVIDSCLYSLDGAANVSMTKKNATFFNYTYSGITHGYHNLTVSCNDSLGNWNYATESNFNVNLLDLSVANVVFPSAIYSMNSTLAIINISNNGPPNATNVNVSCYVNNTFFDSKLISLIIGNLTYTTNCTINFSSGNNQLFNVTVDPGNTIPESNENNNNYSMLVNVTLITNVNINTPNEANTTDTVNVNGLMSGNDGSIIADKLFLIKLNNVTVSSDTQNYTNFTSGSGTDVNISNIAQLNLTDAGNISLFSESYTQSSYATDSHVVSRSNEGWDSANGYLFAWTKMSSGIGNITYRFDSATKFYNASAYVTTASPGDSGGNTSLLYSFDNSTWAVLNSSTTQGITFGGIVPVQNNDTFYIILLSNTHSLENQNPVTDFYVNTTSYDYSSVGNFVSGNISLPDVTYTVLKWTQALNSGEIKLQLRESDDALTWGTWSNNYTNNLDNGITEFTKSYLQFRAWLSASNLSLTPVLSGVQIMYFNASTNSTGGYSYNITIPTNSLGILPLEVSITQNESLGLGITGINTTNITIFAETYLPYAVVKNYTGSLSNYSVSVNFTRSDTGSLVNGTINITISNSTKLLSTTCYGKDCLASWLVPADLSYGNYTINITAFNETAYLRNTSTSFPDYLEEKNTTGTIYSVNKTIGDFQAGDDYSFLHNVTINNTGRASMNNVYIWTVTPPTSTLLNIEEISGCTRVYPNQSCNALMNITLDGGASAGNHRISWSANWTDNDGTVSGGAGYISYSYTYVILTLNATLGINETSKNLSIQHGVSDDFKFKVQSLGTDTVVGISVDFVEGNITAGENLSSSWVSINPSSPSDLISGASQDIIVNISIPLQTAPGNYSGTINASSSNGGNRILNLTVSVPTNTSWYFSPATNLTHNNSYQLSTAGEIGNYTIFNLGNINLTMNISYINTGTTNYHNYGTDLFESNDSISVPGMIVNPISVNVGKGENSTITLYQKGDSSPADDVGIIVKFYNESASPAADYVEDAFSIYEMPPTITGIWFILDGVYGNITEQNKNLTIKIRVTDDVGINDTRTKINVTYGGTTVTLNATSLRLSSGEYDEWVIINFTANFTPTASGTQVYDVVALAYDTGGKSNTSSTYQFTSYGTTTLDLIQNYSSINISNVDLTHKATVYINYTINNTGNVYAYYPVLNFTKNSSIVVNNYSFSDIGIGGMQSYVAQVNVSNMTLAGEYNLTAVLTWTNPNTGLSTDSTVFTINVAENKSFTHSPDSILTSVLPSSSNSSILRINNTGNALLSGMNLNCYTGLLCTSMSVSYNESDFNISINNSKEINITLTAPYGLAASTYLGSINISESDISQSVDIEASVPESKTWTLSITSLNITKGSDTSGDLKLITINNTGNVEMTFNIGTTNSTLFNPNETSMTMSSASYGFFMINYSAPSEEGSYEAKINVTNNDSGANPVQINISINMSVTSLGLDIISPSETAPLTNIIAGDLIEVHLNLTYQGDVLANQTNFSVSVGGSNCTNLNSSHTGAYWNITCNAPDILDGLGYNLTVTGNHETYGEKEDTEANAVFYLDVTPPRFNITRNNINLGSNINLQANVTDNVAVDTVKAYLTYPNSSTYNEGNSTGILMSLSGGLYVNNSIGLDLAGEYTINYTANDTVGNFNSTLDWFEVYDKYYWNIRLLNYNSTAVNNVNISLYRPNTATILLNNITGSDGRVSFYVNRRFYDLYAKISGDNLIVRNINFTNVSESGLKFNIHRVDVDELSEIISLYETFQGIASNSTNLSDNEVSVIFNYSGLNYDNSNELKVVKCSNWNYTQRTCQESWSAVISSRDINEKTITGNSTGFSAYFLAENRCGNGLCELSYGETTSTCVDDCVTAAGTTTVSGGGGGGGSSIDYKKIEELIKSFLDIGGVKLETTSIYKEMFAGESTSVRIKLRNTLSSETTVSMSTTDDMKKFFFFESSKVILKANEIRDVLIKIVAPKLIDVGNYDGDLILKSAEKEGTVPVTIRILEPEGKLLDVKIQPLTQTVAPGGILRLQTDLLNLGETKKVDIQFDLQLLDVSTGEIITRTEEAFAIETTLSTIKNMTIPLDIKTGRYMVKAIAYYSNLEQKNMQASSIAYINVNYPFLNRRFLGIPMWTYMLILLAIIMLTGALFYVRYLGYKKKRFKVKVELNKLPQPGPDSAFTGKVAETGIRTFADLNKMQMHTLIAGATGGGKTIVAQDLVEEALLHKKSVIVFDPTAQWTGFLRKCEDKGMLKRYKYFDMKETSARAFNGSIKTIHDPYEIINIKDYINREGEITIFNISNLTPKEMDIIVASTIEQVFENQPEESKDLKTLIVYDEVHRLLPKFGGSGKGFIQLERGAREFRKWGIGLILISQVLSDFIGEIKANIGTEIQMGTRYEGDLERINIKYGEDVLKSVVKEPIGTGMVVNAEYNSGRPYFVSFRPLLHGIKRLSNAELEKYEKYFDEIDDLDYQTSEFKNLGVDVLDLELEIKLTRGKVKEGSFQMADMYLETLRARVIETWKSLGKPAKHLVRAKLSREKIESGIEEAKKEREKYIKKTPQEALSLEQEISNLKKKIEVKKKEGKKTVEIEMKISDLENRIKGLKGKLSQKDKEGVMEEIEVLNKTENKI